MQTPTAADARNSPIARSISETERSLQTEIWRGKAQINELIGINLHLEERNSYLIQSVEELRADDEHKIINLTQINRKLQEELEDAKAVISKLQDVLEEKCVPSRILKVKEMKLISNVSEDGIEMKSAGSRGLEPQRIPTRIERPINNGYHTPKPVEPSSFFLSLPSETKILFLGETGVGKATFINSLVNYIEYENIEDAAKHGPTVIIPVSFQMQFDKFFGTLTRVTLEPSDDTLNLLSVREIENSEKDQPSSQLAKEYKINLTKGNQTKTLHIIDTPSIGDVRGTEQDKINLDSILNSVANYEVFDAICILIDSNAKHLNELLKHCIDQLLMGVHEVSTKSIVFCFTNTRATHFRPGDSYSALQSHLLKNVNGAQIELNSNTLYSLENEGFRYLCAKKKNHCFPRSEVLEYKKSYDHSVREVKRLFANFASRKSREAQKSTVP